MKLFRYPIPILIVMILLVLVAGSALDSQRQKSFPLAQENEILVDENVYAEQRNPLEEFSEVPQIVENLLQTCANPNIRSSGKLSCYVGEFEGLAYRKGAELPFLVLTELQKQDSAALPCHLIAHAIGEGVFHRNPEAWKEAMRTIPQACSYGAIHGIIEEYLLAKGKDALDKETLPSLCGPKPRGTCNHIVGHLALVAADDNVDQGLGLCSALQDSRQRFACFNGVFMENITALNLIAHGYRPESQAQPGERLPEFEKLCREHKRTEAVACWQELAHEITRKFRFDAEKVFDFCNTAPDKTAARHCKLHALDMFLPARRYDLKATKEICKLQTAQDPTFENACYSRLAFGVIVMLPSRTQEVAAFCSTLGKQFQSSCFEKISTIVANEP